MGNEKRSRKENKEVRERVEIGYFSYPDKTSADDSDHEMKRVYKLEKQIDYSKPRVVHLLYDKVIANNALHSPAGMIYLVDMYRFLESHSGELDHELQGIPAEMFRAVNISDEDDEGIKAKKLTEEDFKKLRRQLRKEKQDNKNSIMTHRIVIAFLAVAIVVMFVIAIKSDTPNILNYETAIQNKYAAWEAELEQREEALRLQESEK